MFYKSQAMNPDKHPAIPGEYPWVVSSVNISGDMVEISQPELDELFTLDISEYEKAVLEENNLRIQNERRIFGEALVDAITDKIGARNLTLIAGGTPVDIAALGGQMNTVATVIRGGAIVTGSGILSQMVPYFPNHADILQECISKINEFVSEQTGA